MYSDESIIKAFVDGDTAIITTFYDEIVIKARHVLKPLGAKQHDIEDVVQEAVVSLFTNIRKGTYVQKSNVQLSTYAIQICKYQWYNIARQKRSKNLNLDEIKVQIHDDFLIDKAIEEIERNRMVHAMIDQLGDHCKNILKMFYWEKASMQEMADTLGMQANSVKNAKYRCVQKLKELVEQARIKDKL